MEIIPATSHIFSKFPYNLCRKLILSLQHHYSLELHIHHNSSYQLEASHPLLCMSIHSPLVCKSHALLSLDTPIHWLAFYHHLPLHIIQPCNLFLWNVSSIVSLFLAFTYFFNFRSYHFNTTHCISPYELSKHNCFDQMTFINTALTSGFTLLNYSFSSSFSISSVYYTSQNRQEFVTVLINLFHLVKQYRHNAHSRRSNG